MTGSGRLCNCNSGICIKSPLCDYDPFKNPFQSSSGVDLNPYERNEDFKNHNFGYKYIHNNQHNIFNNNKCKSYCIPLHLIIIILVIFIIVFLFIRK
jgi:hypothetical protein